jgi:hypothetical protein
MILIGIDDTDVLGSKGTNQLAKAIVQTLADRYACVRIVRHQLLSDPRVPYTSKNGSASIALEPRGAVDCADLIDTFRQVMKEWYVEGSDPGLCVDINGTADAVSNFGRRCQQEVVTQWEAREVAAAHGLHLEGLGGTEGGVIGALAAVGLAATADDGRIVQHGEWPDDLMEWQPVPAIRERGIDICDMDSLSDVQQGIVDLHKRLRPNVRNGRGVLFVRRCVEGRDDLFEAVRLP